MHGTSGRANKVTMAVAAAQASPGGTAPAGWEQLRADETIQFAPVTIPEQPPREPGAIERFFDWLRELVGDLLGGALGEAWPVLRWVLLGLLVAAFLFALWRFLDPLVWRKRKAEETSEAAEWQPEQKAALALLADADRLAAEGRYDEATHLLLLRSVNQIATARPDWVPPSSTARELARLPALPDAARHAFLTISERVERSLFALRALERSDWEAARAAYAEFALARLDRVAA